MPGTPSPPQVVWTSAEPTEFLRVLHPAAGTYRLSQREKLSALAVAALFLPTFASVPWTLAVVKWLPGLPLAAICAVPIAFLAAGAFVAWGEAGRVTTLSPSTLSQHTPGRGAAKRLAVSELSGVGILRKGQQAWLRLACRGRSYTWPIPLVLAERIGGRT